jgi:hypothetical protein
VTHGFSNHTVLTSTRWGESGQSKINRVCRPLSGQIAKGEFPTENLADSRTKDGEDTDYEAEIGSRKKSVLISIPWIFIGDKIYF